MAEEENEERSERQQFKGDRLADSDLGTKVTSTGGKKKRVRGPHERAEDPAPSGDTAVPEYPADNKPTTAERQQSEPDGSTEQQQED